LLRVWGRCNATLFICPLARFSRSGSLAMLAARLIELWVALIRRGRLWRQTIKFLNHPINEDGRGNGHQSHQSDPQYSGHHCTPLVVRSSGSLAIFTAIRRASSRGRLSSLAAGFYFASQILIAPTITPAAASAARSAFSASQFSTPPRSGSARCSGASCLSCPPRRC
jgi:hypothetical protein